MTYESSEFHSTKTSSDGSSDRMSSEEDTVLAQSLLASISEITESVVCVKVENETFMEIGCYLHRTSPAIMELQTSENTPPNAREILQSLSKSVDHAKFLVGQCNTGAKSIPDPAVKSIIEQLNGVIRNIGESLSLIPSSFFRGQEYAEVAIQSLSREMQNAQFEISQNQNQIQVSEPKEPSLKVPSFEELTEVESESTETDLYAVDIEVSTEIPKSVEMPSLINFLRGMDYFGQGNHGSSSSKSLKRLPQVAEYMEPLYETFFCPLTKNIMDDPVTVSSGVTYERRSITEWFNKFEESAEDVICPTTGKKLVTRVLSTNIALKTTIEEWKERNEATRIKVARAALSLASSESMILEALKELQYLCQKKQYNKVQVRNIGIIPLLTQFMVHKDRKVRCMTLETLRLLAEEDDETKEMITKTKTITTTIKMLSSKHLPERHAALSFLLELSTSEPLCEKIGSVTGGILMLITMKYNQSFDAFTVESANKILKNLERYPKNIKFMAENGLLEPLLNHLIEGTEEMQIQMGDYLGELVLGHDTETYVAERASPSLIKMVHSGKTLKKKAAFKALAKISSYHPNSRTIVEAGIIPIMIEEMFTGRIHNKRMNSKEESAAILANILNSGIPLETIQVNSHGHKMTSDYIVYNLIQLLINSTSEKLNINLIKILLCLIKTPKSTSTVVSVIKETDASYTLIEFINSPFEELGIESLKLLITLTPYMGHTLADRLCKTKGQPENLIKNPTESTRITEKHAVSANFLAKLPHQNLPLNLALLYRDTVPTIIQTINEIQRSGTRTSRFANLYLEGLVGILVRFTTTLYETQVLQLARNYNFTSVFTELLMRSASDEVQRLSAIGLEKLSVESINLSKPPQIKRTKFLKLFYLPRFLLFLGSSKQRQRNIQAVCPVHKGACSSETTFCLVDAKAVERLLACLDHENGEVVEAALSAICTLLDDKVDVEKSVNMLNEVNTIQHVLNVLREHKQQEGLWQKSFWMIERFLMKGGDRSISDISEDRLLPSTLVSAFHHGDEITKQMAEKILRHLKKMPNFSTQFS
ncbi:Armadillo [Macleaya cordata]|uniref:RING-type E3 ubiquitin transferase n=1 Tax=Macleaya cordata TaxID=56857 RepID=A0A200R2F0_MACCD|nr:Armadillo [Macleaya cordata]